MFHRNTISFQTIDIFTFRPSTNIPQLTLWFVILHNFLKSSGRSGLRKKQQQQKKKRNMKQYKQSISSYFCYKWNTCSDIQSIYVFSTTHLHISTPIDNSANIITLTDAHRKPVLNTDLSIISFFYSTSTCHLCLLPLGISGSCS